MRPILRRVDHDFDDRHTVMGVLPERFWFSETNAPIWTLLDRQALLPDDRLDVIARREPGVTPALFDARLQVGLAIGAIATWVPSRRALRINPAVLLRST